MIDYIDIDKIKPASYNPRKISSESLEELQNSIKKLGFIIPILVNRKNNTIIAGHQRTKTAHTLGLKKLPCICINNLEIGDEIKFNQLHNALDKSLNNAPLLLKQYEKEKFVEVNYNDFTDKEAIAPVVKEICKLMVRYGNVLTAIICKKQVVYGCEYIKACKLLKCNANCYILDDDKYNELVKYIRQDYGVYSYDAIKRNTFVQGLAQLNRSVEQREDGKAQHRSRLYYKLVIPWLKQNKQINTILDFGCGKGAYIKFLKERGYKAIGVEFYNNNYYGINSEMGNQQIDTLISYLKNDKHFDCVVCDSVLNSVDSIEAENSVMTILNLFAKSDVFISGRSLDEINKRMNFMSDSQSTKKNLFYLDENSFTADYRKGQWYFQHFHNKQMVEEMCKRFGFEIKSLIFETTSYRVHLKKIKELSLDEYKKAIDFEFNLPLPNGKSYNRQSDIKKVLGME